MLINLQHVTIHQVENMIKKIFSLFFLLIFTFISVNAQEAKIEINHIGYGKTLNEAVFTIHCTGEVMITNINVSVDGKLYEQIDATLGPNKGLQTSVFLDPGEHTIEVRTPEGAYDSLNLTISSAKKTPLTTETDEKPTISRNTLIYTALGIVIIIFVVVLWLLIKKSEPKLEQAQ